MEEREEEGKSRRGFVGKDGEVGGSADVSFLVVITRNIHQRSLTCWCRLYG